MARSAARRSQAMLLAVIAGLSCGTLCSYLNGPLFVSAGSKLQPSASARRAVTAVRGFKEDFESWRSTLSADEKALLMKQAKNEYNKKFRKTDEFKQDLPEEKVKAFGTILGKFFDAEAEDYKKEIATRTPDYDGLKKKTSEGGMDFSLKNKILEVDRDGDRRYQFATQKIRAAQAKGEMFPQSSPLTETWVVKNDDEESHKTNQKVLDFIKKASEDPSCPPDAKPYMEKWVKEGIPAMGTNMELDLPQVMVNQMHAMYDLFIYQAEEVHKNSTVEEWRAYQEKLPGEISKTIKHLTDKYVAARDEVQTDSDNIKAFFRSQKDMPGKTKADVLKEIWAALPKAVGKDLPPLDEDLLAELSEFPANNKDTDRHSWGTADKLWKSEAIDAFGSKYLLGVFETKEEATKAFNDWNVEYEKAREDMKSETEQWGKQEQARLDRDTMGQERIKKILEEARR